MNKNKVSNQFAMPSGEEVERHLILGLNRPGLEPETLPPEEASPPLGRAARADAVGVTDTPGVNPTSNAASAEGPGGAADSDAEPYTVDASGLDSRIFLDVDKNGLSGAGDTGFGDTGIDDVALTLFADPDGYDQNNSDNCGRAVQVGPDATGDTDLTPPVGAPGNQAPVIGNLDGDSVTYTEDAMTSVRIDFGSNATVSDPDSGNFNGGSLTVALTEGEPTRDRFGLFQDGVVAISGNNVSVNGVLIGTVTGIGVSGGPMVITFTTDDATPERVQLLLHKVFFGSNTQQNPVSGERTITVTLVDGDGVADGGSDTTTVTTTVMVIGVNDAPTGTDRTITINEDAARALLVADFGFDDHGGSTQSEGQSLQAVIITTLPATGTLYIDTDGAGVGDLGTAVTAGQSVSAADISAGRLVYVPAADANGAGAASFTFQVQDNGGTANGGVDTDPTPNTITFNITAVNDAPVIGNLSGETTSFTEGGSLFSAMLDAGLDATVSDVDNANFDGGSLRIQVTNAVAGEDFIYFNNSNPAFGLTFSGSTLSYNGVAFATFTAPSADRIFTFDADATPEAVQSLVRSLAYYNSNSLNPSTATRTVTFTLNDGSGGSTSVSTSVNVVAVNDEPTGANNTVTGSEDSAYVFTVADFGFSDSDGNNFFGVNFVTVPATGTLYWDPDGPGGLAAQVVGTGWNIEGPAFAAQVAAGALYYVPEPDGAGTGYASFSFQVKDDGGLDNGGDNTSPTYTMTIDVEPNNPPVLDLNGATAGVDNTAAYTEQAPIVTLASGLVLSDDGGTLTGATVQVTGGFVPLSGGDGADYLGISGSGSGTINGITYLYSANTGILTLSGTATVAAYQAVLAQVSFQSTTNNPGASKTITWTVNDGSSNSAPVTTTITVTEVNDAPVNAVPGAQSGTEDSNLVFSTGNGNAISVSDRDATTLTVTLSVANGVLTLPGTAGLSFGAGDGTDDATMTFTGTAAAINAALDGLVYRGNLNYSGDDTLTVVTNDGGGTGIDPGTSGGATDEQDVDTVTITLAPDGVITGDSGDNTFTGTAGADFFDLSQGGDDTVSGGDGNDGFYFGGAYTSGDTVDGGAGALDQIGLQGDYSVGVTMGSLLNTELVVLLSGNDTRFGDNANNFYDYNLVTTDATVAAGQRLVVQGNALRVGENLTFDGSAELDGYFLMYGGHGTDVLTGGAGNDGFYFGQGRFGASDVVNGGAGTMDQLALHGDYTGANAVTFGAAQLSGIEMIVLLSATNTGFGLSGGTAAYDLTMNNGNVGAGETLAISANTLGATETLNFNGSAETDGNFLIFGGEGNDVITGGAGDDVIFGGGRGDTLTGGGGNDIFAYRSVTDSNSTERDGIQDFNPGDRIDLSRIDADIFAAGNQDFTFIGTNAFSGTAGELRFENISLGGPIWIVQGDVNGDGVSDLEIVVVTPVIRALTVADFIGVTAGAGGAPQVLPPQEEVLTKDAKDFAGPQVLPTQGNVSIWDATDLGGPQVLPGQVDDAVWSKYAEVAQVLPGLTADDFVAPSKDAGGPQVLPVADTGLAAKDAVVPQVLPGLGEDDFIVTKAALDAGPQVLPDTDDLVSVDGLPNGVALKMAIWADSGHDLFMPNTPGIEPEALTPENNWGWV